MSNDQKKYIKKLKINNIKILLIQISIIVIFLSIWELLVNKDIISGFIYSSPSRIIKTIIILINENNLFIHIYTTLIEVIVAFLLGIIIGFVVALLLYQFKFVAKIVDPFLTMLNSLPKVALGPLIIIISGANGKSIIIMALLINLIVSIITIYNGFISSDEYKIKLLKSMGANKLQILTKLVIPQSYETIITSFKLNISLTLIGLLPPVGEKSIF